VTSLELAITIWNISETLFTGSRKPSKRFGRDDEWKDISLQLKHHLCFCWMQTQTLGKGTHGEKVIWNMSEERHTIWT